MALGGGACEGGGVWVDVDLINHAPASGPERPECPKLETLDMQRITDTH